MRIAAGVLLIILSIVNAIAGAGYGFGGALVAGANEVAKDAEKGGEATAQLSEEEKAKLAEANKAVQGEMGAAAAYLGIFGIFLLVLFGLQIAAAVTLFMSKAAGFVLVVGVLGIAAELAGAFVFGAGFGFWKIYGLATSVLAILASRGYAGKAAAA